MRNFKLPALYRGTSLLILAALAQVLQAQQSNTLFFMHSLPESNFINPAVQIECKWFVGLPVISSVHLHASNSGFTAAQLLKKNDAGGYRVDADNVLNKLANRNLLTTELHTTILALGLHRDDYYYTFTIMEKDNLAIMYSRDAIGFALKGNTQFEGQWINFRGTGILYNHVREYAFGISKVKNSKLTLGARARLLFGKLNLTTGRTQISMYTQENTFDLLFDVNARFNSSLPYSMGVGGQNIYRFNHMYDAGFSTYFFNRRNPGVAVDLGFIYKYSDRLTYSGSLLDLGMILYRSNLTNYSVRGNYLYRGPIADSILTEHYLWDVFDGLNANTRVHLGYDPYVFVLDPRLYLGATYRFNNRYYGNLLLYNRFLPVKIQTSVTASVTTKLLKNLEASVSWSYMNRSVANLGIGFGYGKTPVQIYLVSDNVLGFILPMSTKNVNLRFGLNLNFGCRGELDINQCGCAWLRDAAKHSSRNEEFRRGKKVRSK
jgi:hypothetical protein